MVLIEFVSHCNQCIFSTKTSSFILFVPLQPLLLDSFPLGLISFASTAAPLTSISAQLIRLLQYLHKKKTQVSNLKIQEYKDQRICCVLRPICSSPLCSCSCFLCCRRRAVWRQKKQAWGPDLVQVPKTWRALQNRFKVPKWYSSLKPLNPCWGSAGLIII